MIRAATHADIQPLCDLLEWAHGVSEYAGKVEFDRKLAQKLVVWGIGHMGRKASGGTLLWLAETSEGIVSGIMFGMLQPIYMVGKMFEAKDIYFFGRRGIADRMDMAALFRRFMTWAEADERVFEIRVSSSATLMPEIAGQPSWRDLAPYFERRGFEPSGDIFVRRIER